MPAWLGIGLLAALLALVLWWRPGDDLQLQEDPGASQPRYAIEGARWRQFDDQGQPLIEAEAHVMRLYRDERLELGAVTVRQLGDTDTWQLRAPGGLLPAGGRQLRLDAPVSADAQLGDELLGLVSGPVWIDRARQELNSDAPVTVTAPNRRAQALGWSADWAARRLVLRDHVEVTHARP